MQQQANDHQNRGREETLRSLLCAPHTGGIGFGRPFLDWRRRDDPSWMLAFAIIDPRATRTDPA
jgi:hypothetical protein